MQHRFMHASAIYLTQQALKRLEISSQKTVKTPFRDIVGTRPKAFQRLHGHSAVINKIRASPGVLANRKGLSERKSDSIQVS